MQLELDELGRIPKSYPRVFYRVSNWMNGSRVADFDSMAEAKLFAIEDAKNNQYDHKVSEVRIS